MFSRQAFNPASFTPNSFSFEIIDDGEEEPSRWGTTLGEAHAVELETIVLGIKKAKRKRDEFTLMVMM